VRELENVIERAFILCSSEVIGPRDLGEPFSRAPRAPRAGRLRDQERELIEKTLAKHGGNRTHAAQELGISRRTLLNKIKEAGLDG
jgi:two-component system, NtrC family, response regulator AtoC